MYGNVMYCFVMYCYVMYCDVMYCGVMYCDVMCCDVIYCDVMYCYVMCCCDVLLCDVLLSDVLLLHCTSPVFRKIAPQLPLTIFTIQIFNVYTYIHIYKYICIHRGIYILSSKYVESQLWPFGGSYPIFKHSRHIVDCDPHFCWLNPFTSNLSTEFLMVCWVWTPVNSPRLVVPSPQEMVMVSKCIWMIYIFNHIYVKCVKWVVERILKYVCGGGFWCLFCSFPQPYVYIICKSKYNIWYIYII